MKKSLLILIANIIIGMSVAAEDYSKYYVDLPFQIEQVQPVLIPDTQVSIVNYGAVADGQTLCTDAFNTAIKELSKKGGGHIIVPNGIWLSGPITLKSNIDLHLEKGAIIRFSTDKTLFLNYDKEGNLKSRCKPCISASHCENVAITGQGTIDGQGYYWRPVKLVKSTQEEWDAVIAMGGVVIDEIWYPFNMNNGIPNIASTPKAQEKMRTHLVNITNSKNVLVEGVTLINAPKFHLVPSRCQNVIIDRVTVRCPWNAQNGDAIDIGNTQVALVVNCNISCGDDGICMKGGVADEGVAFGPNRDFLIQNDTVYRGHGGFVIGSEFSGGMQRLIVRNCHFDGTEVGLRFKSAPGRGGWCEDIWCSDIVMKDIMFDAIAFETGYADMAVVGGSTDTDNKKTYYPDFAHFTFKNITCVGTTNAMRFVGMKHHPIHDLKFENVSIYNAKYGLDFKYAEDIHFVDCKVRALRENTISYLTCKNLIYNGNDLTQE